MANSFVNTDKVAAESVRLLVNNMDFVTKINQKYSATYKAPESFGSSVRIRVPTNNTIRTGKNISASDHTEEYRTLTIDTQKGVDKSFSNQELTLDIKEYSDRVLRNEMEDLAVDIEKTVMDNLVPQIPNLVVASSLNSGAIRSTKALMAKNLSKRNNLCFFMNPDDEAELLGDLESLFHYGKEISNEFTKGSMGTFSNFDFFESNLIPNYDTGGNANRLVGAGVTVNGAASDGDVTLTLAGVTASQTPAFKKGEVITVTGTKNINIQTKQAYAELKQFTILADANSDGAGACVVSIAPVYGSTTRSQNVDVLPANGATVTSIGAADSSYAQNFAFHKDFATVAFMDPISVGGTDKFSKKMHNGVGMKYVRDYVIGSDDLQSRWDTYFGDCLLRGEYAARLIKV